MKIFDIMGQLCDIGLPARYSGTGTIGKITSMKNEGNNNWIQIEGSDLWYNTKLIEIIKNDIYLKNQKTKPTQRKEKDIIDKKEFDNIDMSTNSCDGAG